MIVAERAHPLDRPVWNALSQRQTALATGDGRALRLLPDIGPFAAAADGAPGNMAGLPPLLGDHDEIWLVEGDPVVPPAGLAVRRIASCDQMVAHAITSAPAPGFTIVPLGEREGAAMHALAGLTRPGPFEAATYRFGGFIGVEVDGALVAMAGERLKPGRFSEVSGVCTHPDHRGRGYAGALMRIVAQAILDRGETPFLHCYSGNHAAIALYETLGFRLRRRIDLTVIGRG